MASVALYAAVALVGVGVAGSGAFAAAAASEAAPLGVVAERFGGATGWWILAAGATVAMIGVLLNLVLGLSRVLLAMGRRGDAPAAVARLAARRAASPAPGGSTPAMAGATPVVAVWVVGAAIAALALAGSVETTWSFSAFTVLVYYALTNLAALRLPPEARLVPRAVPVLGLAGCLFLAFWVDPAVWATGLALIAAGLLWHLAARRHREGRRAGASPP